MTNEEEKILEEENNITLEQAAEEAEELQEEAEELQEEVQDEVKEVREEIPDDVRLDPDEIRERPVLRGGLRGAADPNMIQKHIDNFLAMLCGETPVDSNVRTSAEYWLKRLATGEGGGSTKKIYWHTIRVLRNSASVTMHVMGIILTDSPDPINLAKFQELIDTPGFYMPVINGYAYVVATNDLRQVLSIYYSSSDAYQYDYYYMPVDGGRLLLVETATPNQYTDLQVTDLGVNAIN